MLTVKMHGKRSKNNYYHTSFQTNENHLQDKDKGKKRPPQPPKIGSYCNLPQLDCNHSTRLLPPSHITRIDWTKSDAVFIINFGSPKFNSEAPPICLFRMRAEELFDLVKDHQFNRYSCQSQQSQ